MRLLKKAKIGTEKEWEIKFHPYYHTQLIDNLIEKKETLILKLKDQRQSIISKGVTGKIDVRDWQQPKHN